MATISAARHALCHTKALAETLRHWSDQLAVLREQGYAPGEFVIDEAHHRALAKLTEAIDLGHRDLLLAGNPAIGPLADEPAFLSLVQHNLDLINAERARLGLAPLP